MRSFAGMLANAGNSVAGTDENPVFAFPTDGTTGRIQVLASNQTPDWEVLRRPCVVHSLAVPSNHSLLSSARRFGLIVKTLPEALSDFLRPTRQICVAGTHGKTTTSGMIWWILNQAGKPSTGFIGGDFCGHFTAGTSGSGNLSVVESCEYRAAFHSLKPQSVVLTGIEPDHFDCYQTELEADQAYRKFVELVPEDGTIVVNADCPRAMQVVRSCGRTIESFSLNHRSDWSVMPQAMDQSSRSVFQSAGQVFHQTFILNRCGKAVTEIRISQPGTHNLRNAVAAILAVRSEGIPAEQAAGLLRSFPGMRRRFEHRGTWNGIDLIDDYAHHPTAVRETLATARCVFPGRRVVAVFEPHQISRTECLFDEFSAALLQADECMILPVLPARETATAAACQRISGRLVRRLRQSGGRAFLLANLDQVQGRLDYSSRPGDVMITMGAGRTHLIHDEIHRRLRRDSAA